MLCRQVIPDTNGIEQIYIVKSENEPDNRDATVDTLGGPTTMEPEEVDEVKQEPPSDDEHLPHGSPNFGMLDVIIKEEPDEIDHNEDKTDETSLAAPNRSPVKLESFKEEYVCNAPSDSGDDSSSGSNSEDTNEDDGVDEEEEEHKKDTTQKRNRRRIVDSEESDNEREPPKTLKKRGPYNRKEKATKDSKPPKRKIIKRFECHYCPKKFSTLFNLERHEKSHEGEVPLDKHVHNKRKPLCFICQLEYETKDELNEHLCTHSDMLPYECSQCEGPVRVISVRLLNTHFQLHKEMAGGSGIITCVYCPARFHSLSGCRQHERGHVESRNIKEAEARAELESKRLNVKVIIVDGCKRYECDYCGKSYSLLATLRRHTNSHTLEKIYVCKTCGKTFNKMSSLTLHEKVHSDVRPYKCETCDKGFKETIRLIEHRRVHTGEKPFQCHCGMAFRKKHLLRRHKKRCDMPEDIKGCNCSFCQEPFPCYADMMHHVKQVHALGMPESRCSLCRARFKDAVQLVIHEQRHKLPHIITCGQCNRIFKQATELEKHMKIHAPESETYICDVCGKIFQQSVNLRIHKRIHKRIHSGRRPHVCDLCPKTFYCSGTMRRHRLTHFKGNSRNFIAAVEEEDGEPDPSQMAAVEQTPVLGMILDQPMPAAQEDIM